MTNGASEGVRTFLSMLIRDEKDAIMIPIPQYPLYSALITLNGGTLVPYYLDESQNWAIDVDNIKSQINKANSNGLNLRSIVVINPGNPTGQVLTQ